MLNPRGQTKSKKKALMPDQTSFKKVNQRKNEA